jgi:diguanylate cyclase (GGDEF)-like protein
MVKRIDPLTKTLNRFGMSEKLETAWAEFKGGGAMFGMLMLDVDYFRRINDTFGMAFWNASPRHCSRNYGIMMPWVDGAAKNF